MGGEYEQSGPQVLNILLEVGNNDGMDNFVDWEVLVIIIVVFELAGVRTRIRPQVQLGARLVVSALHVGATTGAQQWTRHAPLQYSFDATLDGKSRDAEPYGE